MRARLPGALLVVVAATCAGSPASPPVRAETAAAFVARVKAETDAARPKSEVVDSKIDSAGLSGTQHDVRRGEDYVETSVLGPFTTMRGSVGGKNWHQNENGITVLEEPEPAQSATPEPKRTLSRIAQPRDLWLVTSRLQNGAVAKTYYDFADLAIVREEIVRGKHWAHVDYSDFRPWSGGKRRAWKASGGDDRGNAYTSTIVKDDVSPVIADDAFAVPADRRTLVEFPPDVNQVALPATVESGRIHVDVEVNGTELVFVLDTGASGMVIDSQAAKDLKLPSYGSSALTVAGTFASTRVISPVVRVGRLQMRDVVMATAPLDAREFGTRVDGLLGFDFLAGAVLRIDYVDPGGVTAIRPSVFTQPPLATSSLPIRLDKQIPVVRVAVGNEFGNDMIVDTGAEAPVLFFDRFVQAHPAAVVDRGTNAPFDESQNVVFGVGGPVAIVPLRISRFAIADLEFRNYIVLRARRAGAFGDTQDDGLLGALFLRFFTLYVDYPERKLYFEPNENHTRAVGRSPQQN